MIGKTPAPEKRAIFTNSRSRKVSAIDRIVRAPQAQPKMIRMRPTTKKEVLPRTIAPSTIRIGSTGIVINVSIKMTTVRSYPPPMKPALSPINVAMAVMPMLTETPRISELRTAKTRYQKISCPSALVPSGCARLGGRFFR